MATNKPRKPTRAELERKILESTASKLATYEFAYKDIDKASQNKRMGSAVIITVTALGGQSIIDPVSITDGLSDELIAALKTEVARSAKHQVDFFGSVLNK